MERDKLGQRLASFAAAWAVAARARVALALRAGAADRAGAAVASRDDPAAELATHQAFGAGPDPAVAPLQDDCAWLDVQAVLQAVQPAILSMSPRRRCRIKAYQPMRQQTGPPVGRGRRRLLVRHRP